MRSCLFTVFILCITGFHNVCYGQEDTLRHKPFWGSSNKYRLKTNINCYVSYLNDFNNNPAATAFYDKYNLNANKQYSFAGRNYIENEDNARVNFKLKKHGGFCLRYQQKTFGWFKRKTTGLAYNYSLNSKSLGLLSLAFEGCTIRQSFDRAFVLPPSYGSLPAAIMVPDFNAGFIYSNYHLIAEGLCSHILEPNVSFYKTPGLANNLLRNYFLRLSYCVTGEGNWLMPITIVPGVSWSRVRNRVEIFSGLCTIDYDVFAITIEASSDKSWEARFTLMNRLNKYQKSQMKIPRNQLRLNMSYRRYVSLSRDYGAHVGEFRFGLNYNFGTWERQLRHIRF